MIHSAFIVAPVAVGIAYLLIRLKRLEERALDYHKRADHAQRMMEGAKMERDEWEQRCAHYAFLLDEKNARCKCEPKP